MLTIVYNSNIMASNIAKYAGTCTALQGSLMLVIGTIILGAISALSHPSIFVISCIYFSMNIALVGVYVCIMSFTQLRLKTK